jgi:PAS domain S-box-containing protein
MDINYVADQYGVLRPKRPRTGFFTWSTVVQRCRTVFTSPLVVQVAAVFVVYVIAGKLGQATTNIRSGNLGPVWPASGIALAGLLAYGCRAWPGVAAGAFLVAFQSPVSALTALGQSAGATLTAVSGALLLRRFAHFDPGLSRLRDALALIVLGAFGSAILSASIGLSSLYAANRVPYAGLLEAWLIYWLGDATGILLVTPLVFTLPALFHIRSRRRVIELAALLTLLTAACFLIFGDLSVVPIRLHVLAFAVVPFVMWAAIDFGIGGASLSVFLIATMATLLTALGHGPFSANTPFVNATLLDVLFAVLAVSGLALAAVIAERERAEGEREHLIRGQARMEERLRLAAIVESSNDAIVSTTLHGIILSWNAAAQRIFGYTEADTIGQPTTMFIPSELWDEEERMLDGVRAGKRIDAYETIRVTKLAKPLSVSINLSPLRDVDGRMIGVAEIIRDITQHKQAQEALASVSRRLIDAQEQERTRIARELHDDIGQRLALLTLNIGALSGSGRGSPSGHGEASELQQQASQIAADVQALSQRLHSSRLELLGITAAMSQLCAEFAEQEKTTVNFATHDLPDQPSSDVSLCLFRVLQEALHNSVKHSGVRHVEVRLWGSEGQIQLVVKDHGRGFDVEGVRTGRGIGLVSMEERIKLVNGTLSIESEPHGGTTIHARVPMKSKKPSAVGEVVSGPADRHRK